MGSMIIVLIYIFVIYIAVMFLYSIYKVIWYSFKLSALRKTFSNLANNGVTTVRNLKVSQLIFGKKGETSVVLKKGDKTYEINVLSSISTHSRWNIEKTRNHYYFEVRREAKLIPGKAKKHSVSSHDYQKDFRIKKCILNIFSEKPNCDAKSFLLIYPSPKVLTYTDTAFKKLKSGDMVEGYEIIFIDDLKELFEL